MSMMSGPFGPFKGLCNLATIAMGVILLSLSSGCEQRGACCFENNECLDNATEEFCTGGGGMYRGDGSACFGSACFVGILGACCMADGTCHDFLLDESNCAAISGTFQGDNTSCEPNPCGGACCSDEFCAVGTQENCNGEFRAGQSCTPNPCVGACCLEDGRCEIERTRQQCEAIGTFLGDGTNCDPDLCVGACCSLQGECIVINESNCNGEFAGPATSCEPNPCMGACCDDAGECTVTTEDVCSGRFEGGGTVCDATACIGACCMSDATCSLQTIFNCGEIQGIPQGLGTSCEPNPCGGACCSGRLCDVMKEEDCNGEFRPGLSCDPNVCAGACCRPDGTCQDEELEEECQTDQGQYQGDGVVCTTVVCTGACCKNEECTTLTEFECDRIAGLHQGNATTCDPNPCLQAIGACCEILPGLPDSCEVVSQSDCSSTGSTFLGSGTTCESGCPCETDVECPEDADLCTVAVCTTGMCGQGPTCLAGEECNPVDGSCSSTTVSEVCCFGAFCEDNSMGELYCIGGGGTPVSGATCADTPNPCAP